MMVVMQKSKAMLLVVLKDGAPESNFPEYLDIQRCDIWSVKYVKIDAIGSLHNLSRSRSSTTDSLHITSSLREFCEKWEIQYASPSPEEDLIPFALPYRAAPFNHVMVLWNIALVIHAINAGALSIEVNILRLKNS